MRSHRDGSRAPHAPCEPRRGAHRGARLSRGAMQCRGHALTGSNRSVRCWRADCPRRHDHGSAIQRVRGGGGDMSRTHQRGRGLSPPACPFDGPDYADAAQLTSTLEQLGVTDGYGGYWESYAVGPYRRARDRTPIAAVQHHRKRNRTVAIRVRSACLVSDASRSRLRDRANAPCRDDLCISAANLAGLPALSAVHTVGLLQVYVYADDVFAALPRAARP